MISDKYRLTLAILMALAITSPQSAAESIDKQFDDFFAKHEKFEAQKKRERRDGLVLQRLKGRKGGDGVLSIGGRSGDDQPYAGRNPRQNFNGGSGGIGGSILNLRLSF